MKFKATLDLHGKTATGITVPEQIVEQLGGGKRPAVNVTFNGFTYRTTIGSMRGLFLIPVSAEIRAAAGAAAGDTLSVDIELDTATRDVEIPDDLASAFTRNKSAAAFFEGLAPSHRKEWVRWITEAKRPETRSARIEKAITSLGEGRKTR